MVAVRVSSWVSKAGILWCMRLWLFWMSSIAVTSAMLSTSLGACASRPAVRNEEETPGWLDNEPEGPRGAKVLARTNRECGPVFGSRQLADQETLLRELASILGWISTLQQTPGVVSVEDWCRWGIEMEEGLRSSMPTATPPPVRDLPTVDNLRGLARARITSALGEPAQGCCQWERDGRRVCTPCAKSPQMEYDFYHFVGGPGGGPTLQLAFDSTDACVDAKWMRYQ
jgi:hypothetical protein